MKDYVKKFIFILLVTFLFWFVDTYCVKALNNIGPLSGLTISENGRFNDHRSNGSSSIGYQINNFGEYYSVSPTSSTQLTHNGYGASIVQCDMSFAKGNYYSVSYYFLDDSMSFYFHPYYTSMSNKLAIGDTTSLSSTNFTYETVNSDVQRKLVDGLGYISSYTIIFKAPQTGTCLLSAFSSSPSGPSDALSFVGYTYKSLGTKELSASDIQNALSSSFTSISNKIDQSINAATGSIIGSITNGNDSINSNIDELKEKQEEAHETSKGIWGTLKSLVSSIGNWFTDLMSSIGDGFKNLIEGIKALFVGEEVEECKVIKNNFTTYTHWIDDTSLSVPNYYARPVDSDGYIQLYYNSNLYRISDNYSPIKPNTEYTLYVESSPSNSLGSFIFYPSKYNTSNSKNKYRFPSMNTNKTLAPGESAIFYITSNSEDDVNYSLSSMFAYTDYDKQQGGALYARIMLLEGHYTESEIKEKGYFKTEKEICEITNKGGLFGIIKDLGSSIGKLFSSLTASLGNFFESLLSGILDGLKALFIPDDGYFSDYFSSLYDFFNKKLGILIYPLDLLLNILNRFINLSAGTGVIHIPNIEIGSFGVLIHGRDFYLNEYWFQEPYKTIYNVYKIFVNFFVAICLVKLARKKEKEITEGGS